MWMSSLLLAALILHPGGILGTETAVEKGGGFVWLNVQGVRTPGEKLKSDDAFRLAGYTLEPPSPGGWTILHKAPDPRGIGFARRGSDRNSLTWAASFILALDGSIEGIVRGLVGQPHWRAPEGFLVLAASGREALRGTTRCVRVAATARLMTKGAKRGSAIDLKAECLACPHPTAPTLHVVLMHAERKPSTSPWTTTLDDAERFLAGVQFGNLATPIEENVVVQGLPFVLESHAGFIWAALADQNTVVKVQPDTGEVIDEIALPGPPKAMQAGHGSLWIIAAGSELLHRVSADSNSVETRIELASDCRRVAVGPKAIWVICELSRLLRVDPQTHQVVASIEGPWLGKRKALNPLPPVLTGAAYSEPWLWVADGEHSRVFRIDPLTDQVTGAPVRVGRRPLEILVTEGALWTINRSGESVSRLDRRTGEVLDEIKVDFEPITGRAQKRTLWIANSYHHAVTRIDTSVAQPEEHHVWVGIRPMGLAVHGDHLWVADGLGGILSKVRIAGP